jgi:hypothetical protein
LQSKQTKQTKWEGRRKTISIYTNNNNLTNLNVVSISLLLLCGKSYAIGVREGGKKNLKKRRDE